MDVHQAVTSRRAVRRFTDRQVPRKVLERVLTAAAWSPSGSSLQPWHAYVVTGGPLAEIKKHARERLAAGNPGTSGTVSAHPQPCSATWTAAWAGPGGPTSVCICRPSCCCSVPKGCTVARSWRGRSIAGH